MAAPAPPNPDQRNTLSSLWDFFFPAPIEPVEVPVSLVNDRPLSAESLAQLRREQANAIDEHFDEELDFENYETYTDPKRKLRWTPGMSPDDELWHATRDYYTERVKNESVGKIIDDEFEEMQKILISPQAWSNEVQAVRDEQSREYYANLSEGGAFKGQPDNLITKLAMVHFGLPVAPITMNNIIAAGRPDWNASEHDEQDGPPTPPRYERIVYTEKPLEFLSSYHERSWGHHTIRRPRTVLRGGAGSVSELESGFENDIHWGTNVSMRGGAAEVPSETAIYNWDNHRINVNPLTEAYFSRCALLLLGLEETSEWEFMIDVYRASSVHDFDRAFQYTTTVSKAQFPSQFNDLMQAFTPPHDNPPRIYVSHVRPRSASAPSFREDIDRIKKAFPTEASKTTNHWMNSYFGKRIMENKYRDFKWAAFALLDIDSTSNWSFLVDIHRQAPEPVLTIPLDRANYRNTWITSIRDQFLLPNTDARIFVRHNDSYPIATSLEPPNKMMNLVRLVASGQHQAYWKVPLDLEPNYGINQIQPAFFRACVATYGDHRPTSMVHFVDPSDGNTQHDIGIGAMELHNNIWVLVKSWIKANIDNNRGTLSIPMQLGRYGSQSRPATVLGLRMIGSHLSWQGDRQHMESDGYYQVWEQMVNLLTLSQHDDIPSRVRLWFSPEEREKNVRSVVLDLFKPVGPQVAWTNVEKRQILQQAFKGHVKRQSNTIWFRPEYEVFQIRDARAASSDGGIKWDTRKSGSTLGSFRSALKQMFVDDWTYADRSFTLIDQHREGGDVFTITEQTTEDQWRMHVFDWLTTRNIYIHRKTVQRYIRPDNVFWGYRHLDHVAKLPPLPPDPHPEPVLPIVMREPRIPKSRLKLPAAEKAKTQKWDDYMTEQHRRDALQHNSYIRDQSVIEPGYSLEVPIYGPSQELQLGVSLSTPTIYAQRLTPTDIKSIYCDAQKWRNALLERINICSICSESFNGYEKAKIQSHFSSHLLQLQKEGHCPSCDTESWSIMTMQQKKEHLQMHQIETDTELITKFWDGIECSVCDARLSGYTSEQVMQHMSDHVPGIVEHCHRCGLHLAICTNEELVHHRYKCLQGPDRELTDPEPIFCENCGQTVTNESDEQRARHVRECHEANGEKKYCVKCGIDESAWSEETVHSHDSRCTSPMGTSKKYCLRCGTRLLGLTREQHEDHKAYCAVRTKTPESLKERIEELKVRTATQNRIAAKNANTLAWIERKETALADKKQEILTLMSGGADFEPPVNEGYCPFEQSTGCTFIIDEQVTRHQLFLHLKQHALNDAATQYFRCPLRDCGQEVAIPPITGEDRPGVQIIDHYRHINAHETFDVHAPRAASAAAPEAIIQGLGDVIEKVKQTNRLTQIRNASPLPRAGEAYEEPGMTGSGAAASGVVNSESMRSGYSFKRGSVKQSVEFDLPPERTSDEEEEHDSNVDYNLGRGSEKREHGSGGKRKESSSTVQNLRHSKRSKRSGAQESGLETRSGKRITRSSHFVKI